MACCFRKRKVPSCFCEFRKQDSLFPVKTSHLLSLCYSTQLLKYFYRLSFFFNSFKLLTVLNCFSTINKNINKDINKNTLIEN